MIMSSSPFSNRRVRFRSLVVSAWLLALPIAALAAVTETFDGITDGGYGAPDDYGTWFATNSQVYTVADKAHGGTGRCLVFNKTAGAYLLYEGDDGAGKDGGLGTVSIWYRHWTNTATSVKFQAEYSQDGGAWISLGSEVTVTSPDYAQFTVDANVPGDNIQVRFRSTAYAERLCLDDVSLGDMNGPAEDPNLSAPASLAFAAIAPGTASTQVLALANSGASNTLHLTSLSPASGDTGKFSVGAVPASLGPGATAAVSVVYAPGAVTGVSHSAVFKLITDDPSTPTNPITFSGSTVDGALTISNVQYSVSGPSPQVGNRVTLTGIATYADSNGYAFADAGGGPWSGIYVADLYHRPDTGDQIRLNALVQETANMTVLTAVSNYLVLATNQAVPLTTIRGNQVTNEAYEGVLVSITNVTVKNTNYSGRIYWQAGDSSANFLVTSWRSPYRYIWQLNSNLTAIHGLVFTVGATNSVSPRFDADFIGRPVFEYALRGLVMTPDGPRTNWTVHVRDDVIVAVTNVAIAGVTNVTTGGIIYPGLIDTHNHPSWNTFPTLMFNDFPFGHRDEWAATTEYSTWKNDKLETVKNHAAVNDYSRHVISKYAECLELMAGCIAIQGNYAVAEYAHPDVVLKNIEQFPSRIWADIFPWKMTAATDRADLLAKIAGGAINSTMIHLCEGTDTTARAQFATWRGWGMLTNATTIIHGAALQAADFAQMAAAGAKMVWSPMSNMKLYGGTANVKAAKQAGVTVGLAPDWTASGCYNILEELGYAWQLNTTMFSNAYTAREMCDMVTLNNAKCAGIDGHYGKILPGYNAGLCVIEGDLADPYLSLIRARPPNVLLTVVDGTPRYGEPALMAALGVAGEAAVAIDGRNKIFNIAVNHPFLLYGNTTFAQLRAALQTAHATLTPSGELDRDELQFLDLPLLQGNGGDDVAPFRADSPLSSAPATAVTNDVGGSLTLAFRYQDFWDNDTFITNLAHTISIAPARYSNLIVQTIATNRPNTPANQTVNFTVGFQDMHTNYVFVFETRDAQGNVRTTVSTNVFKVKPYAGGDTDRDGLPNEWEIAYFGGFSNALATANADGDWLNNYQEYVADTVPTNASSVLSQGIDAVGPAGTGVWDIPSPVPTSTGRVYDVWRTTNLLGQIVWQPLNLNVRGVAGGAAVVLRVTNALPAATYRTGVKLQP